MELNIVQLERSLPDGVVITAHWTASLNEDDLNVSSYGTFSFNENDSLNSDFIPFDDLTEEIVKTWVMQSIGEHIESQLNEKLDALKNPTEATGIPWGEEENNG